MATIADRPEKRARWEDLKDSDSEEENKTPRHPLIHTESYDAESSQCNELRRALSHTMGKLTGNSASPGTDAGSSASPALVGVPAAAVLSPGPAALQSPAAEDVLAMASPAPPPTPETDKTLAPSQGAKLGAALLAHIKGQGEKRPRNAADTEDVDGNSGPARHAPRRSPEPERWHGYGQQASEHQERRGEKRPAGMRSPPQAWLAPNSPSPTEGDGGADDNEMDAQRRLDKRRAIVAQIKDSPEYKAIQHPRRPGWRPGLRRVATPDPEDKGISKRQWEGMVMHWRKTVQAQGAKFLA